MAKMRVSEHELNIGDYLYDVINNKRLKIKGKTFYGGYITESSSYVFDTTGEAQIVEWDGACIFDSDVLIPIKYAKEIFTQKLKELQVEINKFTKLKEIFND